MDVLFGLRKPTRIEIAKICEEPKADLSPAEANGSGIQWFDSTLNDNNLLARLAPLFPPSGVVRLGHPARITQSLLTRTLDYRAAYSDEAEIARDVKHELEDSMQQLSKKKGDKGWVKGRERAKKWDDVRELRKETREAKVVKNVMAGAQIVLSTCHGAGSRQLNNMNFDVCIIDEATQAMEAVCWIPVLKSKKLILAGDPLQLPPTILSANQKSSEIKVKLKPVDFPGNVARLDTSNSGVDPNGVSLDPTLGQAGAEAAEADTGAREMGTADIESVAEGLTILPLTEDRDAKTSDDTATVEDSMASKDTPTSANSMKENNAALKRPKLSLPRTLEMTLFDRLEKTYGAGIKRLLAVQYRIAEFPSKALYASSLISHESVASRRLVDLPTVTDKDSEDAQEVLSPTLVFFDTAGTEMYERLEGDEVDSNVNKTTVGEGSRYNENEAEIVSKWVRQLISFGVPQSDIAIITPYQAQVAHLSSLLRNDFPELVCGSVDGMQGQERERLDYCWQAVILSLVRSNPEREVGFLAEYRRLNVAMTRAKRQLCVVGDSGTVGKGSAYLKQWMNFLEDHADVRWAGYHI
ncbi:hypothetical protein QFC19_004434 [Naganishia cerealis]|uniref:Uncharacterized protein n=1 Tax=Naganishia cerealis TaxID=610337 RepID=A0ACC2VX23_9TREE|nr:hypothetical protein QFC19_004434 [Naganishia cerealis]